MSRLSNLRVVDPVLSNLALGYANDEFVADQILPVVEIEKEGAIIPKFGAEAFRIYQTERALRAASNRISPENVGSVQVVLDEHDLGYPIDYREDSEAAFSIEQHATYRSTEGVLLRREKTVADMVQNPSNFPTGHTVALTGSDVFTNAASDPEAVVSAARDKVRTKIAKQPNTMVMGVSTFMALKRHMKLRSLLDASARRLLTVEDLAAIFEVKNVVVGKALSASDRGVTSDIWGGNLLLAYVAPLNEQPKGTGQAQRSPYEPSFGYTFRKRGSAKVDTWQESGGKVELVRYTDIYRSYILGAEAGYLVTGAA